MTVLWPYDEGDTKMVLPYFNDPPTWEWIDISLL